MSPAPFPKDLAGIDQVFLPYNTWGEHFMLFEASRQPPTLILRDSLPEVEESRRLRLPEPVSGRLRAWLQPFWGTAVQEGQIAPTPR